MRGKSLRGLCKETSGATAIEFAMVAPVFLMMVVGGIYACMMMFSMGSLQNAAQDAARCWSVKTTVCTDASSTQTYAQSHYYGPAVSPTFTASLASCGHSVKGTISYSFNMGQSTVNVPLEADACFP
jgi:Flp pilus assembly protein TadG